MDHKPDLNISIGKSNSVYQGKWMKRKGSFFRNSEGYECVCKCPYSGCVFLQLLVYNK